MKKIITALIMAVILFCLPVSAVEEPVYLPNYGGTRAMRGNYNFYVVPIGTTVKFADDLTIYTPGIFFQAQFNHDYTYHIRFWFEISPYSNIADIFSTPNRFGFLDNDINLTGLNSVSTSSNTAGNDYLDYITYDQSISGNTVTYDLYFNTSPGYIDNIPLDLAYYYCGLDFKNKVDGGYSIKYTHVQVEAWSDREAEIYEEILDQIASNQEVIIEHQGTIINYGSGNQLPSGGSQLSQAESQLSSAEEAVLNKSSDLKQSVADDWNNQKSDARDFVNTITPSTQVFLTVYNDFVSVLPDNVKILFVVLPLLIFIGWLVGRIN